ncbi:unnamed protein product (macronuclear) [Paramecium tetraurelia]|uniref:Transmembrane protein n=1 Tax=Paramecium tetraurelia TaxID=5888 RepID=A0CIY2_PARTE|nr:uncharacterized protein GSPATT00007884001 [Paramecium tetraurelia]CAK70749.1 unnamed protein product [Paramecium tetraurelia]|eukprot:XP_001438146.1 hypothetical protein (macronuclear) [Paramecium tetraurelia strain d4-2]
MIFNKFTLNFKSKCIENDYRNLQQIYIKQEFTLFSIQTLLFFTAYILYYFQEYTYNGIIVANILAFMVSIVMLKFIINTHPSWNEYILPLLQIYIAYIWNLDNFFPTTTEDPNYDYDASYEYNWYYGFQAFYFHFAILQLGYQIWPQAIALIAIYIQYVTYYPTQTLEYLAMCLTIFLVFIGLVVMKYSNEKIKRLQFRDSREQNRWIKIIDQVLEQSIVVIKFDQKQDQLILQQINELSKTRLKIENSKELREMLRNIQMIIEINNLEKDDIKTKNLEQEIRDLIIKNDSYKLITHQVDVRSNVFNKEYKVKLIQQVLQDEYCVIAIFEQNLRNYNKQLQIEVKYKENIFLFLLKQFFQQIKTANSKLKILNSMINFQQIRLLLYDENLKCRKSWISTSILVSQMNLLYSRKIRVTIKKDIQGFVTNQIYLFSILMSIPQVFDEFQCMKIKGKTILNIQRVKITMIGRMNDAQAYQKLFKQNLNLCQSLKQNQKIILKHLQQLISNKTMSCQYKNQIISIYLNKFLLWEGFREKYFNLKTKDMLAHLSFEFEV